jgi:hypothetical protein
MSDIKIAVLNASTVVDNNEARKVTDALQKQVKNDFAPVWGTNADLEFYNDYRQIPAGYWWLVILDDADVAGAGGYHDLTVEGLPLGKVFAKTEMAAGAEWSVAASHELLEMLEDPDINLTVLRMNEENEPLLYSYEVCDACEADKFGYRIDNILISDFVYPSWFEDFTHPAGTKYDHKNYVKKPFELIRARAREGGYIGINKLDTPFGWMQLYPDLKNRTLKMRAAVGARRERRSVPHNQWLNSKPALKIKGVAERPGSKKEKV